MLNVIYFVQMAIYTNGVSVLMPGDNIPTFIAHPAPVPCPSERRPPLPLHQHNSSLNPAANSSGESENWETRHTLHQTKGFKITPQQEVFNEQARLCSLDQSCPVFFRFSVMVIFVYI